MSLLSFLQVIDARSEGRFNGVSPEPRPSLPSGHMTGAINIPYYSLVNPTSKILKSKHELQEGMHHHISHHHTLIHHTPSQSLKKPVLI